MSCWSSSWPRWEVGVALFSWLWLVVELPEMFWAAFLFLEAFVGFFLVAAFGFSSIAMVRSSRVGRLVRLCLELWFVLVCLVLVCLVEFLLVS